MAELQQTKLKESKISIKKEVNDEEPKPYQDHGEAWLSVIAVFINNLTMGGTFKSFGIIYVGLVELYQVGESTTSLASIVNTIIACIGCLITGYLVDRISIRWTVIFGAVLSLAGFTLSAFGPNIYYTIIGYGVITGIGASCFDSPLYSGIALYWNKRKSLANGVAFSGTSIGTLVFPLIYAALIKEYSVRGALLFAGAFWFHLCIAAMLVRKPPVIKSKTKRKAVTPQIENDGYQKEVILLPENLVIGKEVANPPHLRDNQKLEHCQQKNCVCYINEAFASQENNLTKKKKDKQNENNNVSIYVSSNNSSIVVEDTDLQIVEEDTEQRNIEHSFGSGLKSVITNILFVRHLVMTCLGTAAAFGILYLLPALAKEWGADEFVSSLTITVTGASEIIARLISGYCIDKIRINKVWFWSSAHILCAASAIVVAGTKTVYSVLMLASMLGISGTILVPLMIPIMSDYIPSSQSGKGSGMVVCAFNVGATIGYAIVGEASKRSGTYVSPLLIFSGMFLVVSALGLLDIIATGAGKSVNILKSTFCGNLCDMESAGYITKLVGSMVPVPQLITLHTKLMTAKQ